MASPALYSNSELPKSMTTWRVSLRDPSPLRTKFSLSLDEYGFFALQSGMSRPRNLQTSRNTSCL